MYLPASGRQDLPFDVGFDVGFRIVAVFAQDKLLDETIKHVLQLGCVMRTIHDVTFVLEIELSLSTQLTSEVLGWVWKQKRNV